MEARSLARSLRRQRPQTASADGPLVSLVVVNRDGEHRLRRLLDGLSRRTRYRSFEIVLVDNGSTDRSVELVETWSGTTRIVRNAERESFSKANNRGIVAARGDLVLL
ncbi:glycosyltransferase family 2 protein, partial [Ilumatobacter sp.]|uniref:glycosyltransferase family 2 protein n=1 Tax=Ilumatobacter sp. TaxID=1967498 RepID=UPI003C6ED771